MSIADEQLTFLKAANKGEASVAIARGLLTGVTHLLKFGRNFDIDIATTPEDVWNGQSVYMGFPTITAETLTVVSSSILDNGVTPNTGLMTCRLTGQLAGVEQTEDVTLNGVTPVITTKSWDRMSDVVGLTAGSGGVNAGTITINHTTTTTNVFAVVPIGSNKSHICAFAVPTGKTAYLEMWDPRIVRANGSPGSATVSILCRTSGGVWTQEFTTDITTGGSDKIDFNYGFEIASGTDVVVRLLDVSDNNTSCTSFIRGVLIDD